MSGQAINNRAMRTKAQGAAVVPSLPWKLRTIISFGMGGWKMRMTVIASLLVFTGAILHHQNVRINAMEISRGEDKAEARVTRFKVLCWNVHDLLLVSGPRKTRMASIAEAIKRRDPDVVVLQEAFVRSDRKAIQSGLKGTRLAHSIYFRSGLVGSGLFVLSAYPIEKAEFHRFTRNGKWYKPWHGDWWAGKGGSHTRLAIGTNGAGIDVYNCHMHAQYSRPLEYRADRTKQLEEFRKFIDRTRKPREGAIIAGDFNCRISDPEFGALKGLVNVEETLTETNGIDHIFFVSGKMGRYSAGGREIMKITTKHKGNEIEVSDHFGYLAEIGWE